MDYNLILTAQTLVMAPYVRESVPVGDMLVLKNIPAKTYLQVTKAQWAILQQFRHPRTVPVVLGYALEERICLPLGEFFELILKAVRANILLEPKATPPEVKSAAWRGTVRAETVARPLLFLFLAGLVMTLAFKPELPTDYVDVLAGIAVLSVALTLGSVIAGCIIRGAGGEIYRPRWRWLTIVPHFTIDRSDSVMLPPQEKVAIIMARTAILATATGLLAWHRPQWNLLPLVGLAFDLRPLFGGRIASLLRLGRGRQPSDAEQAYLFPPNLHPEARLNMLAATLTRPETWVRILYGLGWTLFVVYLAGWLTGLPPWSITFWKENGAQVGLAVTGALVSLVVGFLGWEFLQFARTRAHHRRRAFRLWRTRWFGGRKIPLDETDRVAFISSSPLFRTIPAPNRPALAQKLQPAHHGARRWFEEFSGKPTHAAVIVSGAMGLFRVLPSGRAKRVHVFVEGDVVGLQDLADPQRPEYRVRSLTPVALLTVDRPTIESDVVAQISPANLTNILLKRPFLRSISLCRNWHAQAVDRFAQLSAITDYSAESVILEQGSSQQQFFIIFEQNAMVLRDGKKVALIQPGEFFGEIGLLQNSSAVAQIRSRHGTRCLSIARHDFLRFVTHNHVVALELERVSSKRLGHPIFPLKIGNFRAT